MKTDTLIIGGGLSGLHTAYALHQRGIEVMLVEARDRLGGRILSRSDGDSPAPAFDLGPTWFWPGQERMAALVRTLDLDRHVFEQPSQGDALYEDQQRRLQRGVGGISMAGSYRVDDGIARITDRLARALPADLVRLDSRVLQIERHADRLSTTARREGHELVIDSARVVVAVPPRLAASSITFAPELPAEHHTALLATPTWMAGHAKLIARYDRPFWRADGLSGDAISYRGPLGEIHDASPAEGETAALFGFVGVPPHAREGQEDALREAAKAQLTRLFGRQAAKPLDLWLKDWAFDPLTATEDDRDGQHVHAAPWSSAMAEAAWQGRLLWSGAETAHEGPRNNGYLEGALEASERTVRQIVPG